jgi:hypothetical protein
MVQITLGDPKFALPYRIDHKLPILAPLPVIFGYPDYEIFKMGYRKQLNMEGFNRIKEELDRVAKRGKITVLLCFEDIRKPEQWCHRRIFAEWWEEQSGQEVAELPERDPLKLTAKERRLRDEKLYNGFLF